MRWPALLFAAWLLVCVQFALGAGLRWGERTPNVALILVAFVGLHAHLRPALLAGFAIGLMHDVIAGHGLGTYAVGYPLAVVVAMQLREAISAEHGLTHFLVTLLLGVTLAIYLEARHLLRSWLFDDDPAIGFGARLLAALVTAALAVPVIALLRKLRRAFGMPTR